MLEMCTNSTTVDTLAAESTPRHIVPDRTLFDKFFEKATPRERPIYGVQAGSHSFRLLLEGALKELGFTHMDYVTSKCSGELSAFAVECSVNNKDIRIVGNSKYFYQGIRREGTTYDYFRNPILFKRRLYG